MSESWYRVAPADEITEDEPASITVAGEPIGVYRLESGFHAMQDICPHAFALLTMGVVDGEEVECPLHEARFHIPTGKCLGPPADRDLSTFEVKVEDGTVFVKV